jgi:hypothetical protein
MLALSTDASIIDFRLDFHDDHFNIKRVNHGGLYYQINSCNNLNLIENRYYQFALISYWDRYTFIVC